MCVSSFLKSTVYDKLSKKKKGKDPKGLLDISQAKHVWVSDLKWFSLQLGHAWHTQQESWLSPCAVKTDDKGVGLLEGFQRVPYIPILSCLERNFAFSSSLLLSIALDTAWFYVPLWHLERGSWWLTHGLYYCLYKSHTVFVFNKLSVSYTSQLNEHF